MPDAHRLAPGHVDAKLRDRRVKTQASLVHELQHDRRGVRLRDRREMKARRVGIDAHLPLEIGPAEAARPDDPIVPADGHRQAGDVEPGAESFQLTLEFGRCRDVDRSLIRLSRLKEQKTGGDRDNCGGCSLVVQNRRLVMVQETRRVRESSMPE